ncbi:putative methyltransferase-like protein [Dirofilaria immitis]
MTHDLASLGAGFVAMYQLVKNVLKSHQIHSLQFYTFEMPYALIDLLWFYRSGQSIDYSKDIYCILFHVN